MKQYLDLLRTIVNTGTFKEPARQGLPSTYSIHGTTMKFNLNDGFPLVTTKKVDITNVITELIWFLRGDTNIKYLVDRNCNIWNKDAYRWYCNKCKAKGITILPYSEFIELVINNQHSAILNYKFGDLDKIYGYQWRGKPGADQLKYVINELRNKRESRYHIISGWDLSDKSNMALPPCHLLYHFLVRTNYNTNKSVLDLIMYQRSCDTLLGVPYNIASCAIFMTIIANLLDMGLGELTWIGGDTHVYSNHIEPISVQLSREPRNLPTLILNRKLNSIEDIESLEASDFELIGYKPYPAIKAELNVGI